MIILEGYDGGTPTRRLNQELYHQDPALVTSSRRHRADLIIHPVRTDIPPGATSGRWYTLHWGHPAMENQYCVGGVVPVPGYRRFEEIGQIGAPHRVPLDQRRAELPPITLDGVCEDEIRMYGGPDELLRIAHSQRETALRDDTSVDAYDWAELAARILAQARALTPPKLDTGQRADVAAVRLLNALNELDGARASVKAQIGRADQTGATAVGDRLLELLEPLDPGHFTRRTPQPTPGDTARPQDGEPLEIRVDPYLRARIDTRRRGTGQETEPRAVTAHRVLNAALADLSTWQSSRIIRDIARSGPGLPQDTTD